MPSQYWKLTCIHGFSITKFILNNQDRNDSSPSTILVRFLHTFCQPPQPLSWSGHSIPIFHYTVPSLPLEKCSHTRDTINICPHHPLIQHITIMNAINIHSTSTIHSTLHQDIKVQLTIAYPTSPTSSSLWPDLIYNFNRNLFESNYIFLYNTHYSLVFSLDELLADIYHSISDTRFDL